MKQQYAYGYVRVSTDKQDELSPDSQEKLLKEYAKKNNIIILHVFFEIGVSGRKAEKRPAFQEMIGSAKSKEHPVDVILVWKYSRFARNQEESIVYKSLLKKQHNVDVISISEPLVDGPFGSLIERIIEWMDEYYSVRLSGEVFRGMKENAMRGNFQARPPLGYKVSEKGKPPVIVPEEAEIIKLIFDLYVNKQMGFFEIARHLNQLGCKTSRGKAFECRSIEYIVQNPVYYGALRWNRTQNDTNMIKDKSEWIITEGTHEPIISKELYDLAQKRIVNTYTPRSRPSSTYKHWLSGVLKCPDCGRSLSACTKHRRNGEPYSYFSCYGYNKGKCEHQNGVSSLIIEKEVIHLLEDTLESNDITFEYKEVQADSSVNERSILNEQLRNLANKEARIKESYINGVDTLEEYKSNKAMLQVERNKIQDELNRMKVMEPDLNKDKARLLKRLNNIISIVTSDKYSVSAKSNALKSIVDRIVFDRKKDILKIYFYVLKPV